MLTNRWKRAAMDPVLDEVEVESVEELALLLITDRRERDKIALAADVCRTAALAGVPLLNLLHASCRATMAVAVARTRHREMSQQLLRHVGRTGPRHVETIEPVASLTLRSASMTRRPGHAGRFFLVLAESGIEALAVAQSAALTNITCYVRSEDLARAEHELRAEFVPAALPLGESGYP